MALTCAELPDGTMKMGKEMTTALVDWNRQHFQQPIRNGATVANGETFSKGLHPHETSPAELQSNTWAILEGNLDRTAVQHHELPFYNALCSTTNEVLREILEEYKEKEFRDYWTKINQHKSSSTSGTYVGLNKAMAIAVTDPVIKDQQQAIMEVIRQMSNACMTSRYILD